MKKIVFTFLLLTIHFSIVAQDDVNLDDLIISSNETEDFSGDLILEEKRLHFVSNNCFLKNNTISLENFNSKKIKKKLRKSNNRINNVVVKGIISNDKNSISVEKINSPLKNPKKWSDGYSSLYVDAAVSLYHSTIELREKYKVFSISAEEVEDATLGTVTEYKIYDKKCRQLSPQEIKSITSEELSALNSSIKIGGDLLIKQAALLALANQSKAEIERLNMLKKVGATKDAVTAGVFQTAIVAQLPKIINNLKASKQYIEQLQSE